MSFKTERLVELLPDAYGARDRESLLYKLLDTVGAAFLEADEGLKRLLKSHWVDYAQGGALDGLASIFGVSRRRRVDGSLEDDDTFRVRLKAVVPLFKGGGTRKAVLGAVRSALGLPYDASTSRLPEALGRDLERLIRLEEFSPETERVVGETPEGAADLQELVLVTELPSVGERPPQVDWTFFSGGGRRLTLTRMDTGEGVRADEMLVIPEGTVLTLYPEEDGRLVARAGATDVTSRFANLDGTSPAHLPVVPAARTEWKFTAQSGLYDISTFDEADTFDRPRFRVEMAWRRFRPLTFDVIVPYFLREAVDRLRQLHGYAGDVFVFEGLPLDVLQQVVNQTKAAGVLGTVQLSLNFSEDHEVREELVQQGSHRAVEDAGAAEALRVGSVSRFSESHDAEEDFVVGGVYDISTFDGDHGFV